MRRAVFGLGLAQVAITTLAAMVALHLLGYGWQAGLVLGGALAMSSTAIVSKMLAERMRARHAARPRRDGHPAVPGSRGGRVPDRDSVARASAASELCEGARRSPRVKAAVVLAVILFFGQKPMRAWFHVVARQRSPELFMLNVLLVTLGLAALTELAGLSLALGAFLAGMLIAETEYRYQVEEDIKPFRDVLLGLVLRHRRHGARSARRRARNLGWVLLLLVVPVLGEARADRRAVARCSARRWRRRCAPASISRRPASSRSCCWRSPPTTSVLGATLAQVVLAAMVLSMLAAPLVIQFAEPIVRRLTANDWLARAAQVTQIAATTMARQDHVIICGYGRSGQNLARLLEAEDIAFIALDSDPERVREAAARRRQRRVRRREPARGAARGRAREGARAWRSRSPTRRVALKILHHVQELRPELPVIVRTLDDTELDQLLKAGAAEVVPEVLEGSLMLASHSLLLLGVPLNRVLERIRAIREERYSLFRGFFHGATDAADAAENLQPRLHSVLLPDAPRGRPHARRARRCGDAGRGDRRAPARRALAAPGAGLALRGGRRRRAAGPARRSRARRAAAAERLTSAARRCACGARN